jgi:hypothetical protein
MNKAEVRNIIEATLRGGSRSPGPLDLLKVIAVRVELEACSSTDEVVGILARHRPLIVKAFGLTPAAFEAGVERIRALEKGA